MSLDHVGFVVRSLERSVPWWSRFLDLAPFETGTWLAAETDNYVGRILGYSQCDISAAFWSLPGGAVLELLEYHTPSPAIVDMETYNVGNAHLCLETKNIDADYRRMRAHAEFRSEEPVTSTSGPYRGSRICYLRDPDGITIELVEFGPAGRPFQAMSPYEVALDYITTARSG